MTASKSELNRFLGSALYFRRWGTCCLHHQSRRAPLGLHQTARRCHVTLTVCPPLQDQVEAPDCCWPGAAGRGGQLRRFPAPLRRAYIRLLALPGGGNGGGASGAQHSGPLLQTSGGGSGGGQHAAEAVAIPPLPGGGHRPGLAWSLVRRPPLAHPRGVAVQLLRQPPVTAEPTPEPAASQQAQLRGGGLSPPRLDVSTSHTVYIRCT